MASKILVRQRSNLMRTPSALRLSLAAALLLGAVGCNEESGVKKETKITGPEGTTKITKEEKVEKSGKNPPLDTTTTTPAPARNP
jgi:hypothetical protein